VTNDRWQHYLDEQQDRLVREYLDLLRIPSISTLPDQKEEVRRAAAWTARRLAEAGIGGVRIMETGGHPLVYGEWLGAPGKPTLLFYGHFDVQPVDPLELWDAPPFEPVVRDGRVYARGASDMKGNMLLFIIACEALLRTEGRLPVNVKFLLEGEEEVGSPNLEPFIAANRELLACDLCVSADGGNGTIERPTLSVGSRGICALEITLRTAATDLHSGDGGMAPNPIHALVRLLDSMRDPEGRITVAGFYDDVRPLTAAERAEINSSPRDLEEYRARTGLKAFFGEPGFTPKERTAARPTLEVNGIWGGFQGVGTKTVIPREAHAKITCRLVPDQAPDQVRNLVAEHVRRHAPPYAEVSLRLGTAGADPYLIPGDHWGLLALERVLTSICGRPPARVRGGGTVPVMAMLKQLLGVETVTLGGSQNDEQVHAPNEFYRLENWARAQRAYCLLLQEIGRR
jgi:acetylornithine deacetylase/succinyl-diaminopimelate desuccinylase-like protein